jgi:hypothetical protein
VNSDNLTPWGKGQSGNPAGKPKGVKNRSTIFKEMLGIQLRDFKHGLDLGGRTVTVEEAMYIRQLEKAMSGDLASFKEIQDTLHGKMKETTESIHTFTQMGNVKIGGGKADAEELAFDVGKETDVVSEEEDDE